MRGRQNVVKDAPLCAGLIQYEPLLGGHHLVYIFNLTTVIYQLHCKKKKNVCRFYGEKLSNHDSKRL